jgi:hypothetical protein
MTITARQRAALGNTTSLYLYFVSKYGLGFMFCAWSARLFAWRP